MPNLTEESIRNAITLLSFGELMILSDTLGAVVGDGDFDPDEEEKAMIDFIVVKLKARVWPSFRQQEDE